MSADTIDGYVNDIPYMDNVWADHAPGHLRFRALAHGATAPDPARFAYLDLGCGTGLGTALYAALHPQARFVGIDASAAHIAQARSFAKSLDIDNVEFIEGTFQDMLARPPADLPLFDFVVVHGVYSWVDEGNRAAIRKLLRRVCASGAIVFLSYNALPGNAPTLAYQRIVRHAGSLVPGTSLERVEKAQGAIGKWIERGDNFFKQQAGLLDQREKMLGRSLAYQAHELLNGAWVPFLVTDVARDMAQEEFRFVGSALDVMPPLADTTLEGIGDTDRRVWNEVARDFARNTLFRGDLYQAPARSPFDAAQGGHVDQELLCSLSGLADFIKPVPEGLLVPRTRATLENWWTMLRERPQTVAELKAVADLDEDPAFFIWFMVDQRCMIPCRRETQGVEAARALNAALLGATPFGARVKAMAVPLTGAAIGTSQSAALSWLVEQAMPGLDTLAHARELDALLARRGEALEDAPMDPVEREIVLLGHAHRFVRGGRDRMRAAGLI